VQLARLLLEGWRGGETQQAEPDRSAIVNYTHYDYLELAPGASRARIEAAYAALLERFSYGSTDAGQDLSGLVRMIHAAYEVLSDPSKRHAYDAELAQAAAAADNELKQLLDAQAAQSFKRVQDVPPGLAAAVARMAA
jgi:DnaJ-class molecular chaperone